MRTSRTERLAGPRAGESAEVRADERHAAPPEVRLVERGAAAQALPRPASRDGQATRPVRLEDRRAAERLDVTGDVRLRQTRVIAAWFLGRLVDVSETGFRSRHERLGLESGERVDFEFQGRSGMARAVWTRIVGSEAETGFSIVREGR